MSDADTDSVFTSADTDDFDDFDDLFEYALSHSDTSIEEEFGPDAWTDLPDLQTVTESETETGYSDLESVAQYSTLKSVSIAPLATIGAAEVLAIAEGDATT
ncbi:hypothetical protein PILCRDRAFT_90789 [Piloderma croceum F 1598]|uniref:Uncharacterized protein n=1 Tax=Piloderma croceum (strain F 1598) TaxID=765440 RepID=A0A0C3FDP1_PILCF|nr:hypothetical protein PILCRDRAFT_90789 [Piloderma croceum F 1598]